MPQFSDQQIRSQLFTMADAIVQASNGRVQKHTTSKGTYLTLDGKRLGMDLEQYGFFGASAFNWQEILPEIFEDVLMPLISVLPQSYRRGADVLLNIGLAVYAPDMHSAWRSLLS